VQSDLHPFLEPSEAKAAFTILDENGDGHVSMKELQQAVLKIYQERKNLAHALKDTKSVVGKLQLICQIVFHVLGFFSYLVVFQVGACCWLLAMLSA
jgi:mechanosensitive ion channel protein 4/5/6/7/8/9/10